MTDPSHYAAGAGSFLDAIALVHAQMNRDRAAVQQILMSTTDIDGLVIVLGQMIPRAIRTQGMTVEDFLGMEADATLDGIRTDAEGEGEDPWAER